MTCSQSVLLFCLRKSHFVYFINQNSYAIVIVNTGIHKRRRPNNVHRRKQATKIRAKATSACKTRQTEKRSQPSALVFLNPIQNVGQPQYRNNAHALNHTLWRIGLRHDNGRETKLSCFFYAINPALNRPNFAAKTNLT